MDSSLRITSAAISDRGLSEKRPQNEDSYLEIGDCGIYAVADGVGGAQAGEVASQMAMELLGEAFTNLPPESDVETIMRSAIGQANTAIHQMAQELPQLASMATTVVALHVAGNIATIGHVGDSRLYRVDRDGTLFRETDDHSMVAEEVRAGRMTEEQAENHPSRNIISRALGAEAVVEADLKTMMIEPGTMFLLCSDGITRHVTDPEIKGVLTFGGSPADICEYLKGLCFERGAEDNLTAVVVKIIGNAGDGFERSQEFLLDIEETTIATARSPFEVKVSATDESLLEIETIDLPTPEPSLEIPDEANPESATISLKDPIVGPSSNDVEVIEPESQDASSPDLITEDFSMFGNSESASSEPHEPGSWGSMLPAIGMLLLGGMIGLGVYHFVFVPKPADQNGPQLSEMRTANIPLSAFEENRRNVDKDPAGYIAKFGADPQDSEDFYLIGRALMLTGDFPKARTAFNEARNRLKEADPANAGVLADDIAIAIAVTNDTTIQTNLKKEFEAARPTTNSNTASNSNR